MPKLDSIVSQLNGRSELLHEHLSLLTVSSCDGFEACLERTLRSISSSASGLDVISIFSLAADSSIRSIALSGRNRSAM